MSFLECTGKFNSRDAAAVHLTRGAKRVLVSAPAKHADKTIVYGVNHRELLDTHHVVSNGSCTTNCLAPLAKVLNDAIGIERGIMTTIHSYTGDQPHARPHATRTSTAGTRPTRPIAVLSPPATGAAKAQKEVSARTGKPPRRSHPLLRVPTPNVSAVDLTFGRATT